MLNYRPLIVLMTLLMSGVASSEPSKLVEDRLVSLKGLSVTNAPINASGYVVETIFGAKIEEIRGTELELALRELSGQPRLQNGSQVEFYIENQAAAESLCALVEKEELIGVAKDGGQYACVVNAATDAPMTRQMALAQISSRQLIKSRKDGLAVDIVPGTSNLVRLSQGSQIAAEVFVAAVFKGGLFLVSKTGEYQMITLDAPKGAGLFERRG